MENAAEQDTEKEERRQRLHSLAGVYGLGVFLVGHLIAQASALGGASRYAATVGAIPRWVSVIVDLAVAAALVVHVTLGLRLLRTEPSGARIDRYGLRRWTAQRVSAVIVLVFVVVHLWDLRLQRLFFGLDSNALHTVLSARLSWTWVSVPWRALLYVVGIGAAAFHFANGALAARGRRAPTIGLAVLLFAVGTVTVVGISTGTRLLPPAGANSPACGPPPERAPFAIPSR